ncbi:tRNA (adenosine(37)-N6)-threonylcarbamoyltransferase complex ATPase subunit type 1 TsaE [Candidatus Gottesmanbacteria bacterium]|nr:tRNA (adenosine(37)-N6)-threonylcarbamoyltransferase complex ATPase subunit type 1 TsaE [Candidatus Gottesmanbacteria bacterium]
MVDFDGEVRTKNSGETMSLAGQVAENCRAPAVICLYGELGSGKTTFVQGFAKALRITSRLLSPTFVIVRRYQIPKKPLALYHFDLYRTDSVKEIEDIGVAEILSDSHAYVLIEWADKLGGLMPKNRLEVHCSVSDEGAHVFSFKKFI